MQRTENHITNNEDRQRSKTNSTLQSDDDQRQADSGRVDRNTRPEMASENSGRSIRVYEEGLETQSSNYREFSERGRRENVSERLVEIAKANGDYVPLKETEKLGEKYDKRTGESVVYYDELNNRFIKVKDPFAKSVYKPGVLPEDVIYEHIVHNLLFPETVYSFEGISEDMGDVRIVISQKYISSKQRPTAGQIREKLKQKGLLPEGKY